MIELGVDDLLCCDFALGVMSGKRLPQYFPLNETALEQHPQHEEYLKSWLHGFSTWIILNSKTWFEYVFNQENVDSKFVAYMRA